MLKKSITNIFVKENNAASHVKYQSRAHISQGSIKHLSSFFVGRVMGTLFISLLNYFNN